MIHVIVFTCQLCRKTLDHCQTKGYHTRNLKKQSGTIQTMQCTSLISLKILLLQNNTYLNLNLSNTTDPGLTTSLKKIRFLEAVVLNFNLYRTEGNMRIYKINRNKSHRIIKESMRPSSKQFQFGIYINPNAKTNIVWNRISKINWGYKSIQLRHLCQRNIKSTNKNYISTLTLQCQNIQHC